MNLQNAKGIKELSSVDCMDKTFRKIIRTRTSYHSKSLTLMRRASDLTFRHRNYFFKF